MRTKMIHAVLLALLITGLFAACKKDEVRPGGEAPISQSIIEDPQSYIVFVRYKLNDYTGRYNDAIYDFTSENKLTYYSVCTFNGSDALYYEIVGDTILVNGLKVKITKDKVINDGGSAIEKFAIIKKPETNQLAGKAFTGSYYRADGSILHASFYYQFNTADAMMNVGLVFPGKDRQSSYTLIGNVAAFNNEIAGYPGDMETMVLVDNKLFVNYFDKNNVRRYHGAFAPK